MPLKMNDLIEELTAKGDKRAYEKLKKLAAIRELLLHRPAYAPTVKAELELLDPSRFNDSMLPLIIKDMQTVEAIIYSLI